MACVVADLVAGSFRDFSYPAFHCLQVTGRVRGKVERMRKASPPHPGECCHWAPLSAGAQWSQGAWNFRLLPSLKIVLRLDSHFCCGIMWVMDLNFLVCYGILCTLDIQLSISLWNSGVLGLKFRLCCRILFLSFGRSTCLLEKGFRTLSRVFTYNA